MKLLFRIWFVLENQGNEENNEDALNGEHENRYCRFEPMPCNTEVGVVKLGALLDMVVFAAAAAATPRDLSRIELIVCKLNASLSMTLELRIFDEYEPASSLSRHSAEAKRMFWLGFEHASYVLMFKTRRGRDRAVSKRTCYNYNRLSSRRLFVFK